MTWAIGNRLFFSVIFLSGFAALIYQLIWVRLLGLVFGVSSFAVATVVGVFLLGLGLGSYWFGKWADRTENPLRTYALIELSIAALSLCSYLVITELPLYKLLYEHSYNSLDFYGLSLVRLLLSVIVLLPPVFAIGGTIPLISKYYLTTAQSFGSQFSRIYYMNTVGAFAGSMLTGFVFVKHLGVAITFSIAVGLNLLIVLLIWAQRFEAAKGQETTRFDAPGTYMLPVLLVTGFISLSYEILWIRVLSTYGLATSESYALIVSGFLLGFSIGAYVVSRSIDTSGNHEKLFSTTCILTALSGAAVLLVFRQYEALSGYLAQALGADPMATSLALAFLVSLVPAVFMGMLFPLGLRIYSKDIGEIGTKTGKVFFANTVGCVAGSLLTGFLLIPFAGIWNTTLLLVNLSLLIGAFLSYKSGHFVKLQAASLLVVFVAGNLLIFSEQKTFAKQVKGFDVIYYAEGLSGTVSAIESRNYRGLFVDGQNVSGTDPVLTADSKMLAHLPLLIAKDPRHSLTVGYGTGATSYSMLQHGVQVSAVEIEKKVIEAGPLFSAVNFDAYKSPDMNIVLDDARSYIDATGKKFDVIVTDVTNLKYKRNPYLYTREYFEIMRKALVPDGIAAAWLPIGGLSFEDLRILIRTFDDVYPHTSVWYFTQYPTHFIIVIGTPEETRIDLDELAGKMQPVLDDLKRIQVDDEYEVASMLLLGEKDVDDMVAGAALHTDNLPILEFSDMAQYMLVDMEDNLEKLLACQRENLGRYFVGTERQIAELDRNFREYNRLYRRFVSMRKNQAVKRGEI